MYVSTQFCNNLKKKVKEIELLFKFFNPLPRDEYFASVIMVQQAFHNFESQGNLLSFRKKILF